MFLNTVFPLRKKYHLSQLKVVSKTTKKDKDTHEEKKDTSSSNEKRKE